MTNNSLTQRALQAESQLSRSLSRGHVDRVQALVRVTETALTQVSQVHRYSVDAARRSLVEAERIQRAAGKPLDTPEFQAATRTYLNRLTFITESAGLDILRVIDTALR
jgi:hypothetical protein